MREEEAEPAEVRLRGMRGWRQRLSEVTRDEGMAAAAERGYEG